LIEYLHRIQDACGHLPAGLLVALAEAMRLPLAEVYETATFYAHFELLDDADASPPATIIRVCDSLSCEMAGADALAEQLAQLEGVRILRAPCMGQCDKAPCATYARHVVAPADTATLEDIHR